MTKKEELQEVVKKTSTYGNYALLANKLLTNLDIRATYIPSLVGKMVAHEMPDLFAKSIERNATPEILLDAINKEPSIITCLKEKLTPEMWETAVAKDGNLLLYASEKTYDLCVIAIKQTSSAISYMEEFIDDEIVEYYLDGLDEDTPNHEILCIPDRFKTKEFYSEVVHKKPSMLAVIPEIEKTIEMCEYAVKRSPRMIRSVPYRFLTEEMVTSVINILPSTIAYIQNIDCPYNISESDIVRVLKDHPDFLGTIEEQTEEMVFAAVDACPATICDAKVFSSRIAEAAVKYEGSNLKYIDEKYQSEKVCLFAVEDDPLSLEYVSDKYKTADICLTALKGNPSSLLFIDPCLLDK